MLTKRNHEQEVDRLLGRIERYRNAIRDAKALLNPETRTSMPSLLAVREAYAVLKAVVEF